MAPKKVMPKVKMSRKKQISENSKDLKKKKTPRQPKKAHKEIRHSRQAPEGDFEGHVKQEPFVDPDGFTRYSFKEGGWISYHKDFVFSRSIDRHRGPVFEDLQYDDGPSPPKKRKGKAPAVISNWVADIIINTEGVGQLGIKRDSELKPRRWIPDDEMCPFTNTEYVKSSWGYYCILVEDDDILDKTTGLDENRLMISVVELADIRGRIYMMLQEEEPVDELTMNGALKFEPDCLLQEIHNDSASRGAQTSDSAVNSITDQRARAMAGFLALQQMFALARAASMPLETPETNPVPGADAPSCINTSLVNANGLEEIHNDSASREAQTSESAVNSRQSSGNESILSDQMAGAGGSADNYVGDQEDHVFEPSSVIPQPPMVVIPQNDRQSSETESIPDQMAESGDSSDGYVGDEEDRDFETSGELSRPPMLMRPGKSCRYLETSADSSIPPPLTRPGRSFAAQIQYDLESDDEASIFPNSTFIEATSADQRDEELDSFTDSSSFQHSVLSRTASTPLVSRETNLVPGANTPIGIITEPIVNDLPGTDASTTAQLLVAHAPLVTHVSSGPATLPDADIQPEADIPIGVTTSPSTNATSAVNAPADAGASEIVNTEALTTGPARAHIDASSCVEVRPVANVGLALAPGPSTEQKTMKEWHEIAKTEPVLKRYLDELSLWKSIALYCPERELFTMPPPPMGYPGVPTTEGFDISRRKQLKNMPNKKRENLRRALDRLFQILPHRK